MGFPDGTQQLRKVTNILIISPEPWDEHFVSKHHYAMELAQRGVNVLFYGPPSGGIAEIGEINTEQTGLQILRAPPVTPGLRFMPRFLRNILEARWLRRIEALAGKAFDVVWLFENSRFYGMQFAGDRLKIYHQVDLNQDYHPDEATKSADFAFCTSSVIQRRLSQAANEGSTPLEKIRHGTSQAALNAAEVKDLGHELNIVYIGNLSIPYLDLGLLSASVSAYPQATFHFVGGGGETLRGILETAKNVVWHGRVPPESIPGFTQAADVLLVAYAQQYWDNQATSPHKMMEYLASGCTIVATWTEEYRDHTHLLEMIEDPADFVPRLGQVLSDLPHYNSDEKSDARRAFALDHTYARQLDRIADALGPHGDLIR